MLAWRGVVVRAEVLEERRGGILLVSGGLFTWLTVRTARHGPPDWLRPVR